MESYSPDRRTALLFCGTGAHGAYHAGVLRALQEAGVKIDVVAGHGIGAAGAALAAIDGGARLWDAAGIWRGPTAARLYQWKLPLRVLGWLVFPFVALVIWSGLVLAAGGDLPALLPMTAAFLAACMLGLLIAAPMIDGARGPVSRRAYGRWWWRLLGAPLDARPARELVINTLWHLIRGAAPLKRPDRVALGRRYAEVLLESLGQPGFRELMIVAHDLDTRRDVVAALLRDDYRRDFMSRRPGRERHAEALELAGIGRDHAIDILAGAATPPLGADPSLVTFGADTYWRGETHRLVDRPGAVSRLLEELSSAGVSQVVVVSAVSVVGGPHRLTRPGLSLRDRIGEFIASAEAAALRDAIEQARLRFDCLFPICPAHNAVGPLDTAGAYDEASDRRQTLTELMERGYEDAYRHFIEPVVGASGDELGQTHGQRLLDDADSRR